MTIKKLMSLLLAIVLLFATMTGCEAQQEESSSTPRKKIKKIIVYKGKKSETHMQDGTVQNGIDKSSTVIQSGNNVTPTYKEILSGAPNLQKTTSNPIDKSSTSDPYIFCENGVYYMYNASKDQGFFVRTSSDCKNWSTKTSVYVRYTSSFARCDFSAPEVYEYIGKYYLVYSARKDSSSDYCIGIAVADNPKGPFRDLKRGGALYAPNCSVSDPSLFFDNSGSVYLYFTKCVADSYGTGINICGIEVSSDLSYTRGNAVTIAVASEGWEEGVIESPSVVYKNGAYYLVYSAGNYCNETYRVGYAIAKSPLGAFQKGIMVVPSSLSICEGAGRTSCFWSPNKSELFVVYNSEDISEKVCIDRVIFNDNGGISINGPSTARQPLPSGSISTGMISPDLYTIIGKAQTVGGTSALLSDRISFAESIGYDTYDVATNSGYIEVAFNQPTKVAEMWLYSNLQNQSRGEVYNLVINDEYIIKNLVATVSGDPAVVTFSNLPYGTQVSNIKIFPVSGNKEYVSLSEIYFFEV